jgi:hypothetical protein
MLRKSTVIDSKNIEISLSARSRVRLDCSYPEHLKVAERRYQIAIMTPLIHKLVAAEGRKDSMLVKKLEEQLAIERAYLLEISRVPAFTIDSPLTTTGK